MISVIIPTYNEPGIDITVKQIIDSAATTEYEIIIVDASPNNSTRKALRTKVNFFTSPPGRAKQMNLGAKKAKGHIYFFVHADTTLPRAWDAEIETVIQQGYDAGGFHKHFEPPSFWIIMNELYSNAKATLFGDLLGDNTMFVKRSVFRKLRGFRNMPILEDVDFSNRLKDYKVKVLKHRVITSSRRFFKKGPFRTLLLFWKIRILYLCGVSPKKIKKLYWD